MTAALVPPSRRSAAGDMFVPRPPAIEAHSPLARQVFSFAQRIAPYDSSVLITGESGAGKEVLARFMHAHSRRADGPFLAVNCGALPETLLESELFGHKAGAFTGAIADRVGLFEQARGGTIFLDEIGDITPALQIKLLRVLQEKEIMPVGQSQTRRIDVRVIAATNRDLNRAVREGTFREDLYYRLGVIELEVPPLRDRREDILPLAEHFVRELGDEMNGLDLRLDPSATQLLLAYRWPGNVRELANGIERAAVLCRDGLITADDLPPAIRRATASAGVASAPAADPVMRTLAQVEHEHILAVLARTGGNRTTAAKVLGISQATLWRKLKNPPTA
ncbi:MAG: Regulatory protein AtoC [Phycisphaerae bacterium]|nr:Regulatory protein AtoC [Phycisphaerae bacterium]